MSQSLTQDPARTEVEDPSGASSLMLVMLVIADFRGSVWGMWVFLFFLQVLGTVWIISVPLTSAQVWSNITERNERWRLRYCMTRLEAVLASSITMSQCYWTVWSQCHVVKRQDDPLLWNWYQTLYFFLFAQPSRFFSLRLQFVFIQQTGPFDGLLSDL